MIGFMLFLIERKKKEKNIILLEKFWEIFKLSHRTIF